MIETISPWPSVRLRHESAPLLKEREQYLIHLLQQGYSRVSVRNTAASRCTSDGHAKHKKQSKRRLQPEPSVQPWTLLGKNW